LVDVLLGKSDDRIRRWGHDRVSTFGIGKDLTEEEWRGLFRQLIARGLLEIDPEGHGALRLTDRCRPYLKGEMALELRKRLPPAEAEKKERRRERDREREGLRPQDRGLFESLRALRKHLADQQGLPPFAIFHDATLVDLVKRRPASLDALRRILGLGESKLKRYGPLLLETMGRHPLPEILDNKLSDTVNETLILYSQGLGPDEIARRRELKSSTIWSHLAAAIEAGLLDARQVVQLEPAAYDTIVAAMEDLHTCESGILSPLYEALGQAYDYGVLKCVVAAEC
jgi:ATP-dependent DNA helicase RecQ